MPLFNIVGSTCMNDAFELVFIWVADETETDFADTADSANSTASSSSSFKDRKKCKLIKKTDFLSSVTFWELISTSVSEEIWITQKALHIFISSMTVVFFFSNIIETETEAELKLLLILVTWEKKNSEDIFCLKLVSNISATDATTAKKLEMRKTWLAEQQVSDNTLKNKINIVALHDNAAN